MEGKGLITPTLHHYYLDTYYVGLDRVVSGCVSHTCGVSLNVTNLSHYFEGAVSPRHFV